MISCFRSIRTKKRLHRQELNVRGNFVQLLPQPNDCWLSKERKFVSNSHFLTIDYGHNKVCPVTVTV
uniref:Uncharacterized protein n=1 Tax=Megaselia scalaris TaxID=36166 RepID=T1GSA5_MEGSC